MDVLITNDDGIYAPGLRALWRALVKRGHDVHVVAPMRQQSGVGHSLTFYTPLQGMEFEERNGFSGFGVYGTPTDCVKLAFSTLLKKKPDLVISGINAGHNAGPDILYSGTVGAATEACFQGLPSIALSCNETDPTDLDAKAEHGVKLAEFIDWSKIPPRRVVNINYPAGPLCESLGIRVCAQTSAVWENDHIERIDPRGNKYWWVSGEIPKEKIESGSDLDLLAKKYITVTALKFEFTDEETMSGLKSMGVEQL